VRAFEAAFRPRARRANLVFEGDVAQQLLARFREALVDCTALSRPPACVPRVREVAVNEPGKHHTGRRLLHLIANQAVKARFRLLGERQARFHCFV
jgi:hypothetical protein